MREDGTTLSDESHELYVYKVRQNCCIAAALSASPSLCLFAHFLFSYYSSQTLTTKWYW